MTRDSTEAIPPPYDLIPEQVDARLRACALLSRAALAGGERPLVDMSARSVTARLDAVAEISALSLELSCGNAARSG